MSSCNDEASSLAAIEEQVVRADGERAGVRWQRCPGMCGGFEIVGTDGRFGSYEVARAIMAAEDTRAVGGST